MQVPAPPQPSQYRCGQKPDVRVRPPPGRPSLFLPQTGGRKTRERAGLYVAFNVTLSPFLPFLCLVSSSEIGLPSVRSLFPSPHTRRGEALFSCLTSIHDESELPVVCLILTYQKQMRNLCNSVASKGENNICKGQPGAK